MISGSDLAGRNIDQAVKSLTHLQNTVSMITYAYITRAYADKLKHGGCIKNDIENKWWKS